MSKRTQKAENISGRGKTTEFLNVDVEVISNRDLTPLASALKNEIIVLFVGRARRRHELHFEILKPPRGRKIAKAPFHAATCDDNADRVIQAMATLIERLPRPARKLWDGANARHFNVGIQAGQKSGCVEFPLQPQTLVRVAELNAKIVTTIYTCEKP